MTINNQLLDFGLIMDWGYSYFINNIKTEEDISELKNIMEFLKENKPYFQFYQVQGLISSMDSWKALSFNKKLPIYDRVVELFDDFSKIMFQGSVFLYMKKGETEDRKSFELKDEANYQKLFHQAFLYSQDHGSYLDFVVPEYFNRNKNNINKENIKLISDYLKTNSKVIKKELWSEMIEGGEYGEKNNSGNREDTENH